MKRPRYDVAINAQLDRKTSLLRDVVRSGGRDKWSHLFSHGHKYPTVLCAVRQGYLRFHGLTYEITEQGESYLADIEATRMREQ